ncbi:GntR family transcriptional regulator [Acuticoccus sediminis]|uniref:GntR family transcriptional regulator n=1 Tax=Acuticoccus sediminis TaxID=2184697 RepID=UPI001CFDE1D9|nr:GntR family transcriptional regulator [Acuticoccus sediminis]
MEFSRFETAAYDGETVGDVAYRRIRSDIVNGRLPPLEKLKLDTLKTTYNVSVTTLREILNRLAVEELVTAEGQRGFRVAPISAAELQELADLRVLLECHALEKSIRHGDLDWEADVVSAHYKLSVIEAALLEGQPSAVERWVRHDWGFHHAMISACNTRAMMRTHSSIFDRYMRYHMLVLDFRGRPVADDHQRLRDLVLARDVDGAVALLTRHVQSGVDYILGTGRIPRTEAGALKPPASPARPVA